MQPTQKDMDEFRRHLRRGSIQKAYGALLSYMMGLRTHFHDRYPKSSVSGLYQGYLDMSYFAIVPPSFKRRGLKIAIVFNYGAFRFEAWLAAANRQIQRKYWKLLSDVPLAGYRLVTPAPGIDSIIECDLADHFDFQHFDALTAQIEAKAAKFTNDMERVLSRCAR